jgi:signal transduction histidine kinase
MQTQPEIISGTSSTDPADSQKLLELFEVECLAAVPLWYNKQPLGLLIADNLITGKPISEDDLTSLETFANYATNAIKDSLLYEEVRRRIQENDRHITELEAMQDRLIRSKRLSDLGELASKVAHEIRTPLVSIGGFARAILKRHGADSPDYEELKIIVEEVRRLEKILRNVLTYVSPGIPRTEPTDLAGVANRTLRLFRPTLKEKGIKCSTRFPDNLPEVDIDPEQIALVLTAIVSNAVESMPNGGRLTLGLEHIPEFLQLSISDTGWGIPESDMTRVFDAFFTTKSLGSGLGLNIASQIIANHKGSIHLESKVGVGSTFLINFPRTKVRETSHEHLVNRR